MKSSKQLAEEARITDSPNRYTHKQWIHTASSLLEKLELLRLTDIEQSYVYGLRATTIIIEILPKTKDFNSSDQSYIKMKANIIEHHLPIIEKLKIRLEEKFQNSISAELTPCQLFEELVKSYSDPNYHVLVLDFRNAEVFIQEHMMFTRHQQATRGGVVNIEPDWLSRNPMSVVDVEEILKSFSSGGSSLPKILFQDRNLANLLVIYDQNSVDCLHSEYLHIFSNMLRVEGLNPKLLVGGFEAWKQFLEIKSYNVKAFVEIGNGSGQRNPNGDLQFNRLTYLESLPSYSRSGSNASTNANNQKSRQGSENNNNMYSNQQINNLNTPQNFAPLSSRPINTVNGSGYSQTAISNVNQNSINIPNNFNTQNQQNHSPGIVRSAYQVGLSSNSGSRVNSTPNSSININFNNSNSQVNSTQNSSNVVNFISENSYVKSNQRVGSPVTSSRAQIYSAGDQRKGDLLMPSLNNSTISQVISRNASDFVTNRQTQNKYPSSHLQQQQQPVQQNSDDGSTTKVADMVKKFSFNPGSSFSIFSAEEEMRGRAAQSSKNIAAIKEAKYPDLGKPAPPFIPIKPSGLGNNNTWNNTQQQSKQQQLPSIPQFQQFQQFQPAQITQLPQTIQQQASPEIRNSPPLYPRKSSLSSNRESSTPVLLKPKSPPLPPKPFKTQLTRSSSPSTSPRTSKYYSPAVYEAPPPLPQKPLGSHLQLGGPGFDEYRKLSYSELGGTTMGMVGLKNLGNTCFMNSILQCLSGTMPLARYFLDGSFRKHINKENRLGSQGVIATAFASLLKTMWSEQDPIITPSKFKQILGEYAPQFQGNEQQDSQEFLSFLLDAIHEDVNMSVNTARGADPDTEDALVAWGRYTQRNWSIIVDMFQGQLKSVLKCLTCSTRSTSFNAFMYLSLPIPEVNRDGVKGGAVYLEDCLDKFVEVDILDGEDKWHCPQCKCPRKASKTMTISKLPPILLIHFKRFYHQGPFRNKIDTYIEFPMNNLDMQDFYMDGKSNKYDLYAISNHFGGLNGGHYTAQVKNQHKQTWLDFDDSRVSGSDNVKSKAAYILFYVRETRPGQDLVQGKWWSSNL